MLTTAFIVAQTAFCTATRTIASTRFSSIEAVIRRNASTIATGEGPRRDRLRARLAPLHHGRLESRGQHDRLTRSRLGVPPLSTECMRHMRANGHQARRIGPWTVEKPLPVSEGRPCHSVADCADSYDPPSMAEGWIPSHEIHALRDSNGWTDHLVSTFLRLKMPFIPNPGSASHIRMGPRDIQGEMPLPPARL